ncbi:MAG TPA: FAD-binding oxidoreductase [Polyangiaceae bacterium LLY-WYZ-15_(1-7)]|nr:FAD-binding oxidoreductase [Polyangiaceae bacterium LLY-WYZ-15_(1-7)]HJL05247.1 FAD-binding oxidoreductase [Polyangiaceae bacterium LLY-WYZ-15_(1-7)]HJL13824.1 FAD-binding oxidoreductase [Polyangiaceae bacterium LLY-WYZ-15_(1-7)]HJL24285.1 FAD-binding oxidoreductase [Polyangiaceae bacterium LLY-WYZ-15_(1-7)]HJL37686.1 FAD-binding oxidoreductase [Polyangiaceae bacterium LLY-WYZ-15_(1-7)]
MKTIEKELAGWGNYPRAVCRVRHPETRSQVKDALAPGVVPRGLGRSYGDPAVNEGGLVLDCTALDRYLGFDEATGTLTCEAGTSLRQIIDDFAPRGWFPMITPGTKFVTVGGCIANDIHGKAHHVDGTFSSCVDAITVLLGDGQVVTASREENADLFWATFGGMGLVGVVLTATMRLRKIETTYFRQEAVKVKDLDALLEAFETYDAKYPYSVAWIDSLATGARLGRGVLTVGDHASLDDLPTGKRRDPRATTAPSPLFVPFDMPDQTLNGLTIRVLNAVLDQVQSHGAAIAHYEKFFYPLDFVGEWNRGYGKRGFTQYQFVIPLEDGPRRIRAILEKIATSGQAPFLNVLKKFGEEQEGYLSFPFEGYTFAIDFPVRDGLPELLRELDGMVLDAGGRIYLGKDAFLDAPTFERMYPRLGAWREAKAKWDPEGVFTSSLGRRVGLSR